MEPKLVSVELFWKLWAYMRKKSERIELLEAQVASQQAVIQRQDRLLKKLSGASAARNCGAH